MQVYCPISRTTNMADRRVGDFVQAFLGLWGGFQQVVSVREQQERCSSGLALRQPE
jgi:hypothetical protein